MFKSLVLGDPPDRGPGQAWEGVFFEMRLPPGNLTPSKAHRFKLSAPGGAAHEALECKGILND